MKAIIYQPRPNARRIKIHVPFEALEWRSQIKGMSSSFFHYEQKLWSVVNTQENMRSLKEIFKSGYDIQEAEPAQVMPWVSLTEAAQTVLEKYE